MRTDGPICEMYYRQKDRFCAGKMDDVKYSKVHLIYFLLPNAMQLGSYQQFVSLKLQCIFS